MTFVYSIDHVILDTSDGVNIPVPEKNSLILRSLDYDPKTRESVAVYVIGTGDNQYQSTLTFRSSLQDRAGGQIRRISETWSSWATKTDDVTGVVVKKPISISVSFNIPADIVVEVADLAAMLLSNLSFLYPSVATGNINTGYLNKLLYGVVQIA